MKLFALAAVSGLAAAPAFAHEGEHMHVHPHGGENLIVFLAIGAAIACVAAYKLFR